MLKHTLVALSLASLSGCGVAYVAPSIPKQAEDGSVSIVPISAETMRYATQWPEIRNSDELARRGLQLRAASETFDDTLRWMVAAGHLDAARCPNYA